MKAYYNREHIIDNNLFIEYKNFWNQQILNDKISKILPIQITEILIAAYLEPIDPQLLIN